MTGSTSPGAALRSAAESVRPIAVWVMLGYTALLLLFALLRWWVGAGRGDFTGRAAGADIVNVYTVALPVLATLLAARVQPPLRQARTVAAVALVLYLATLVFGLLALLAGAPHVFGGGWDLRYAVDRAVDGMAYLALGFGELLLAAVGALAVWRCYTALGGRMPGLGRST